MKHLFSKKKSASREDVLGFGCSGLHITICAGCYDSCSGGCRGSCYTSCSGSCRGSSYAIES